MASYTSPGVYIKDVVSGSQTITQASSSIGILFGITKAGPLDFPKKIGSFTEYIQYFANGLDTPFIENDYLSYSVYGFFQNGGKELYVCSLKKNAETSETPTTATVLTAEAASPGVWGNDLHLSIKKSAEWDGNTNPAFDVTVSLGEDSVVVTDVTFETVLKALAESRPIQQWATNFELVSTATGLGEEELDFTGGSDGDELKDADYIAALDLIGTLDDVTMVGIPGQTTKVINDAIISYCDNNKLFPILDYPRGTTSEEAKAYRKSVSAFTGCICWPWGKMYDPLTDTLKAVPCVGHVMGVYARVIEERGVFKAPAGTETQVRGFIEMDWTVTATELSTLNPVGIICIMSRPNAGIVIWGARSLNSTDSTMRYVSDGLLNIMLTRSLYNGTQWAVFEPNDEKLWKRVITTCKSFLENLRQEGCFRGTKDTAYYVRCDETTNTDYTIAEGQLNIEIGYAPVKPAEFVIIKLAHSIESNA